MNIKWKVMKNHVRSFFLLVFFFLTVGVHAQAWSELGGLNDLSANNVIFAVCSDHSGNIYAAGFFNNGSGCYVAKYNGTYWSDLGSLNANDIINSLCSDDSGNVYAAGYFTNSSGKYYVAKYNGRSWSELGGTNALNADSDIASICTDKYGNVYAAGNFSNASGRKYVAKYDGTAWTELGGPNSLVLNFFPFNFNSIFTICSDPSGNIYAAGNFNDSLGYGYVSKYDGSSWSELGGLNGLNANSYIYSVCSDMSGNIYAAGDFTAGTGSLGGKPYVAKYNGTAWSELGDSSIFSAGADILTLCSDASGNIYASGDFINSSGKQYVAKYNGTDWSELGGLNALAANNTIMSICGDPSRNIYAAGDFIDSLGNEYVAKYSAPDSGLLDGINEIGFTNSLKISPNPTDNITTISLNDEVSDATIRILTISGQEVMEETHQSGSVFTLDVSAQPPGIYIVEVQQPGYARTVKLVKYN